jgi:hypothetical protein
MSGRAADLPERPDIDRKADNNYECLTTNVVWGGAAISIVLVSAVSGHIPLCVPAYLTAEACRCSRVIANHKNASPRSTSRGSRARSIWVFVR